MLTYVRCRGRGGRSINAGGVTGGSCTDGHAQMTAWRGRSSIANGLPASLTITGAGEIPDSHRWDSSPKIRFAPDSLLEGTGFEPSVPRERLVPSFSFTPTFPLARVNRPDPIPKAYITRGPMVRIRLPPAASQQRTVPAVGFDGARLARSLNLPAIPPHARRSAACTARTAARRHRPRRAGLGSG